MPLTVDVSGRSDPGRVRERNEDTLAVLADPTLVVVADGMGGHPAGDVASALAVEAVRGVLADGKPLPGPGGGDPDPESPSPLGERMLQAVDAAERAVTEDSMRTPGHQGMGTTLTALVVRPDDGHWVIGHVGDSRAYLWRDHTLKQLTRDHTWVQEQVDRGAIPPEEARGHPWGNILSNALGSGEPHAQLLEGRAHPGDVYLLCSDGLTAMLTDVAMERVLEDTLAEGLDAAVEALVALANDRGGVDNITVGLLRVGGGPPGREAPEGGTLGGGTPGGDTLGSGALDAGTPDPGAPTRGG